jgi:ubiquinone/menaquinone biosynthesis C-methylase UbiE
MLGVDEGIDPSPRMLEIAAGRGIKTHQGYAEDLPFSDGAFDGLLLALTLCFLADPSRALSECRRILRPEGKLLLGVVPADSPWGREYEQKKAEGHPIYAGAHFLMSSELVPLVEKAGFLFQNAASTLFWAPGDSPERVPRVETGIVHGAGFLGLLFTKSRYK